MIPAFLTAVATGKTALVLTAIAAIASIDLIQRHKKGTSHLFFATLLGTALSVGLIQIGDLLLIPPFHDNAFAMAAGGVLVVLLWKSFFGPWEASTKAAMLSTFLFWLGVHVYWNTAPQDRSVHAIAAATALVPAAIWCMLFLKYHTERLSVVLLLFFSGMLATVPILFYDALVRSGATMNFFFFQITPESFSDGANAFTSQLGGQFGQVGTLLVSTVVSFLLVGIIEETSKYWAVAHGGKGMFTSIDDVMQLSIMTAIGFAFAENIVNPVYFTAFVQDYLLHGAAPDLFGFFGNVVGRSVLTSMVHILATGVMGYFFGMAIFASPYLKDRHADGRSYRLLAAIHRLFRVDEALVFRTQMILTGLFLAILIHGIFNTIVTLPDILPGNPHVLGDLIQGLPSIIGQVPLLLFPSLLYVVGGFWLLTSLFLRKDNMKERGHVLVQEMLTPIAQAENA